MALRAAQSCMAMVASEHEACPASEFGYDDNLIVMAILFLDRHARQRDSFNH